MKRRRGSRSGNALVEFALATTILVPCMAGTFQYGYTFYTYNLLESAVANGARYASFRTYRSATGTTDINKVKAAIKNVAIYGTPDPTSTSAPVVRDLRPANINVTFSLDSNQVPLSVTVNVVGYQIKSIFANHTLQGKPRVTLPYLGRYAPSESEL